MWICREGVAGADD